MLNFSKSTFDYDPFPIGVIDQFVSPDLYEDLVKTFPKKELFKYMAVLGHKYSLSEINHPKEYHQFINTHSSWKRFYDEVKSPDFIGRVLEFLKKNNIDLGYGASAEGGSLTHRVKKLIQSLAGVDDLSTRFEFSMLPVQGGHIKPHSDSPQKIITLVLSMIDEDFSALGGGTEIYRPKDHSKNFNHVNFALEFDEVETTRTVDFKKNHCVVFIKTFNSFHGVSPMKGSNPNQMRKTLTINIEKTGSGAY